MAEKPFPGICLMVQITIAPENVSRFWELMDPVYKKVIAEKECLSFEIYHDPSKPGVFKWVENWSKPVEWLMQNQLTKEYYKEYLKETEAMFLEPRKAEIWQRLDNRDYVMMKPENLEMPSA